MSRESVCLEQRSGNAGRVTHSWQTLPRCLRLSNGANVTHFLMETDKLGHRERNDHYSSAWIWGGSLGTEWPHVGFFRYPSSRSPVTSFEFRQNHQHSRPVETISSPAQAKYEWQKPWSNWDHPNSSASPVPGVPAPALGHGYCSLS